MIHVTATVQDLMIVDGWAGACMTTSIERHHDIPTLRYDSGPASVRGTHSNGGSPAWVESRVVKLDFDNLTAGDFYLFSLHALRRRVTLSQHQLSLIHSLDVSKNSQSICCTHGVRPRGGNDQQE